jgi:hypothetical protein
MLVPTGHAFMKRLLLPLFSVLAWIGCSGSQPGPGAEEDKLRTEASFCADWAKAVCNERVVEACNGTRAGCIDRQKEACRALVPLGYSSKYAEDCVEAARDAYKDAELTAEELKVVLQLDGNCKTLIDGGLEEGDECSSSLDCDGVNGFECVIRPGDPLGTCQIPVLVGDGLRCSTPESVCSEDFYCDGRNCIGRFLDGELCIGDTCSEGFRCAVATGGVSATCIPFVENGEACSADADCASGVCLGSTDTDKICVSSVILTVRDPLCRALR